MSRKTIFTASSLAKAYVEVADWYGAHTEAVECEKNLPVIVRIILLERR